MHSYFPHGPKCEVTCFRNVFIAKNLQALWWLIQRAGNTFSGWKRPMAINGSLMFSHLKCCEFLGISWHMLHLHCEDIEKRVSWYLGFSWTKCQKLLDHFVTGTTGSLLPTQLAGCVVNVVDLEHPFVCATVRLVKGCSYHN